MLVAAVPEIRLLALMSYNDPEVATTYVLLVPEIKFSATISLGVVVTATFCPKVLERKRIKGNIC